MSSARPTELVTRPILAASLAIAIAAVAPVPAGAADPLTVAHGKTIYQEKANCASCHGWAGDGQGDAHAQGHAANLRRTVLKRPQIEEVIRCGRPGTGMPHFDAYAYSDDPCYGMSEQEIGKDKPPEPLSSLQPGEIAALLDYLDADVIGKGPPTKAQCVAYYGKPTIACDKLD